MSKSPIKPPPRRRKRATTRSTSPNSTNSIIQEITFAEALELFVTAKKAEGMRVRTIADYHVHMKYFVQYLKEFYPEKNTFKILQQMLFVTILLIYGTNEVWHIQRLI